MRLKHHNAHREPRTYRDLLMLGCTNSYGTCVSCHGHGNRSEPLFVLGTRANICRKCCEKKGDEVLGSVVRAERKARRWVKDPGLRGNVDFIVRVSGASREFVEAEMAKVGP
jgi:hypothetical protein